MMTGSVEHVALAVGLFLGSHVLLSSPAVRRRLVLAIGERPFIGAYSLIALVLLVWASAAYVAAPVVTVWFPPVGVRHLSLLLMPVACILVVAGVSTANPTAVGVDGGALAAGGPVGITRVTRHPVMWGVGLWGIAHLLANGDAAGMILFGGMTMLALGGALAIDAKKRQSLGSSWTDYVRQTSYLPLAAVVSGRTRLRFVEIGWWRIVLGLALYVVLLFAHPWLFGVDPLPG